MMLSNFQGVISTHTEQLQICCDNLRRRGRDRHKIGWPQDRLHKKQESETGAPGQKDRRDENGQVPSYQHKAKECGILCPFGL